MRSAFDHIRGLGCFTGDLSHHGYKLIKCLLALSLGRLYHERFMEKQREIDGGCVIAMVEQSFGNIECGHAGRLVQQPVEDKLMLANTVYRHFVKITQRLLDIVGIERGE